MLPYGHQTIDEFDIRAVAEALDKDWITSGPLVEEFEDAFAETVGARHAIAVSSGTAALHAAAFAGGLGPGAEAVTSPLTFVATANCALYQGARPVFADVSPDTLNLDPDQVASQLTERTRALLPVDYGGHAAELDAFAALADRHGLVVIEDACHALGAEYRGRPVGSLAHMTVFSFHPVKHITTGEGGIVTTDDPQLARRLRLFRNHGIDSDARQRQQEATWVYGMVALGYNYRLTDVQCALGLSQLAKLGRWVERRRAIATRYSAALADIPEVELPQVLPWCRPSWHLYVVRLRLELLAVGRMEVFRALRAENIGVNVHYPLVPRHPYYQELGYSSDGLPVAEREQSRLLSLPIFPAMSDGDVDDVAEGIRKVVTACRAR